MKVRISAKTKELVKAKKSVSLDIGCGENKRKGAIGMDIRDVKGVDIVHDFTHFPYPIPDECCNIITASHVLEHIPKQGSGSQIHNLAKLLVKKGLLSQKELNENVGETQIFSYLMRFMDESWRLLKEGGQLAVVLPYAGSLGFYQDPTHISPISEATFFYFDPAHTSALWTIYRPKPWRIDVNSYQVNGNLEVVLTKLPWLKEYE